MAILANIIGLLVGVTHLPPIGYALGVLTRVIVNKVGQRGKLMGKLMVLKIYQSSRLVRVTWYCPCCKTYPQSNVKNLRRRVVTVRCNKCGRKATH